MRHTATLRGAGKRKRPLSETHGVVVATHRRHYSVRLDDGPVISCILRGRKLTLACGDRVDVVLGRGDDAVIDGLSPRSTLFFRSDLHRERLIAANVTQVLGVVAPEPPYDDELVHRWIVASESNGCRFVLAANKFDLPEFVAIQPRLAQFATLGYPVVTLSAQHDVTALVPLLTGQKTVLIGQSGMGKSTLINTLLPHAAARVGEVSTALQTGRHTTTETTLYWLDDDSWIVDSPGMKEFGLAHLGSAAIEQAFVELRPLLGTCRFRNCRHDVEPGCAIQDAIERGDIRPWRVDLLKHLLAASQRRVQNWS
jgi:ribosome biogenesis GTPase / thiamine phosphate phosphatase